MATTATAWPIQPEGFPSKITTLHTRLGQPQHLRILSDDDTCRTSKERVSATAHGTAGSRHRRHPMRSRSSFSCTRCAPRDRSPSGSVPWHVHLPTASASRRASRKAQSKWGSHRRRTATPAAPGRKRADAAGGRGSPAVGRGPVDTRRAAMDRAARGAVRRARPRARRRRLCAGRPIDPRRCSEPAATQFRRRPRGAKSFVTKSAMAIEPIRQAQCAGHGRVCVPRTLRGRPMQATLQTARHASLNSRFAPCLV